MILAMIGTTELLLIGGLVLLLFGGKKLPEMMKGMGKGVRSFKEGLNDPSPTEGEEMPGDDEAETTEQNDPRLQPGEDAPQQADGNSSVQQ